MPQFRWIAVQSLGKLAIAPHPKGGIELETDLRALRASGVDVIVSMLGREESDYLGISEEPVLCAKVGIEYVQAPVIDRSVPETPHLIHRVATRLVERMEKGSNVLIHCRMGIGRSSVMAACVMTLQGVKPQDAFSLISEARGFQVPDTIAQKLWVESFAITFSSPRQTS